MEAVVAAIYLWPVCQGGKAMYRDDEPHHNETGQARPSVTYQSV